MDDAQRNSLQKTFTARNITEEFETSEIGELSEEQVTEVIENIIPGLLDGLK